MKHPDHCETCWNDAHPRDWARQEADQKAAERRAWVTSEART